MGLGSSGDIVAAVAAAAAGGSLERYGDVSLAPLGGERLLSTPPYTAYLKIADGCDNRCAYCAIPSIRGRYRSRPIDKLLEEARGLAAGGVRELTVIAQDTTRYGMDIYGEPRLAELLRGLSGIRELKWIRLQYMYPDEISDDLIGVIAEHDNIVKYLDIPIQHAADRVLRLMNRRGGRAELLSLIEKLRERIPGVTLRTTVMVGFPGEKAVDFEELVAFVRRVKFERLGAFAYSREEGTPADALPGHVPEKEKKRRLDVLMRIQAGVSAENNKKCVGGEYEVLIEGYDSAAGCWFSRRADQSPEVDGNVFVFAPRNAFSPGDFITVKVTDSVDYDLVAEPV